MFLYPATIVSIGNVEWRELCVILCMMQVARALEIACDSPVSKSNAPSKSAFILKGNKMLWIVSGFKDLEKHLKSCILLDQAESTCEHLLYKRLKSYACNLKRTVNFK